MSGARVLLDDLKLAVSAARPLPPPRALDDMDVGTYDPISRTEFTAVPVFDLSDVRMHPVKDT